MNGTIEENYGEVRKVDLSWSKVDCDKNAKRIFRHFDMIPNSVKFGPN